jgi:hypothetical protein
MIIPDEPDLAKLFEASEEDDHPDRELGGNSLARCKCGRLNNISKPMICKCGERKTFLETLDGRLIPLHKMTLGHLTNIIKFLATKAEDCRAEVEIAMDLIYLEIGSRDKEITQISGIGAALQRSLA